MLISHWQTGLGTGTSEVQGSPYGAYGPEGPRMREQFWLLPGAGSEGSRCARPCFDRPRVLARVALVSQRGPLVMINHGSDAFTREAVSMPVFYWLSRWFVERGYVVVAAPAARSRRNRRRSCRGPRHLRRPRSSGLQARAAADDIEAALGFMERQPFVDPSRLVVAGVSTGGWAALALAARNPPGLQLVVNFAGGRGGHAYGRPNAVCGRDRLIAATAALGRAARVPTFWAYAENDSFFGPELAAAMAGA